MWSNKVKLAKHLKKVQRKGGKAVRDKYGRDHFVKLAQKSAEVRRKKLSTVN